MAPIILVHGPRPPGPGSPDLPGPGSPHLPPSSAIPSPVVLQVWTITRNQKLASGQQQEGHLRNILPEF